MTMTTVDEKVEELFELATIGMFVCLSIIMIPVIIIMLPFCIVGKMVKFFMPNF